MKYVLLKTKYNQAKSKDLQDAAAAFAFNEQVIEEAFSNHEYSNLGYRAAPSLLAVYNQNGENVLINQTDNHLLLATFKTDSEAKLTEYLAV